MAAVQIGSYCSDFIIQDPAASYGGPGIYYRRVYPNTNRTFYLYIETSTNKLVEIETPFVQPTPPLALSQFQIVLTWDKSVKPVYDSTLGIAPGSDMRNVAGTGTTSLVAYKNSATTIKVRYGSGGNDSQAKGTSADAGLKSYSSTTDTPVEYTQTDVPPYTVERSANAVYLVDDRDNDRGVVTSSTEMRYLNVRAEGSYPDPPFLVYNLYTPGVTEAMIKRACYRINKKTCLDPTYVYPLVYTVDVFRGSPAAISNPSGGTYLEDPRFNITNGNVIGTSADGFLGTTVTFKDIDYIVTNLVNDKSIADLFGDFSIGLFKLSYPFGTPTSLYLGYDCKTVSSTGTCTAADASTKKTMVLKDYFIFRQPMYSCQFRMYNLGTNEYMLRIVDPDSTATRITLRVSDTATPALTMNDDTTTPVTMTERGWSLENQGGGNLVKLRWNYPETSATLATTQLANMYLSITDNVPSLTAVGTANTFVCVKCSKIDPVTGTCSGESTMYIDDDMDSRTSMVPASNYALSGVPARRIQENFTIMVSSSPVLFANVFDDGVVDSVPIGGDRFFTTQSGVTTLTQRTSPSPIPGVVFIGTEVSGGEILYAKLTGTDTKFVRATPPTVEEGFGWRVTTPDAVNKPNERTITSYLDATKGFMGNSTTTKYTFTVNNPNISVNTGAYDPETNTYPLTVTATASVAYKIGTGSWTGPYAAPLNAAPGTTYSFRGNGYSDQTTLGLGETQVYVPPAPDIEIPTTPPTKSATYNSITVSGGVVTNIGNTNSSVVLTATASGSTINSSPVTYGTYVTSGVTVTGLSPNTAYTLGMVFYRGSRTGASGSPVPNFTKSISLAGGSLSTPAGPSITASSVSVSGTTLSYTVGATQFGSPPTIKYARKDASGGTPTTAPAANLVDGAGASVWKSVPDSIVSVTTSPIPGSTGTNNVSISIVPDNSINYNYFFMVENVIGTTTYTLVNKLTIPIGVIKQVLGDLTGQSAVSITGATPPTKNTITFGSTPSIPVLRFTGSEGVFLPIGSASRSKVSLAFVFTLNVVNENFKQLFGSYGFGPGSIHLVFNGNSKLTIALSGAGNWGGYNNNDWEPNYNFSANTPYMLILTADTTTKTIRLRVNGTAFDEVKTYSGSTISNFLNVSGTSTDGSATADRITLGDWISDNTRTHRYFKGDIADFMFYNKALTNTEIVTLEDYVRTRYSGNAVFGTTPTSLNISPAPALSSQSGVARFIIEGMVSDASSGSAPYLSGGTTSYIRIENSNNKNYIVFFNNSNGNVDTGSPVTNGGNRLIPHNFAGKYLYFRNITSPGVIARVNNQQDHYLDVTFINNSGTGAIQPERVSQLLSNTVEYGRYS